MRSFALLLKFHISFSKKEKLVLSLVSLILIITILLTLAFFLDVFTNRQLSVFKNSQYDIVITGFSKENLNTISKQDFVKKVKPWVNLMVNDINNGNTSMPTNLMLVENFDDLSLTYFSDKICIKSNDTILRDYKQNPIVIDRDISKTLHADVGEKVYINFDGKNTITFTVAAIYEATRFATGRPACVALLANEQLNILQTLYGENLEYGTAFISVNDIDKTREYFQNHVMGDLSLVKSFGTDWEDKASKGDIKSFISQPVYRLDQLGVAVSKGDYAPPIVVSFCVLSIFAIAFIFIREYQKIIEKRASDFLTLYVIGVPKVVFFIYFLLISFVRLISMLGLGILIVKYIVYDYLMGLLYLPGYRILYYAPYITFAIIAASFTIAFTTIKAISLKSLNTLKGGYQNA